MLRLLRNIVTEDCLHRVGPKCENPAKIRCDKKTIHERAAERLIGHLIFDQRSGRQFFEKVLMMPNSIGTSSLLVNKMKRRFPGRDGALPPNGNASDSETVVNQRARSHANRGRRQDLKMEPRRRELFQVERICEEFEHGFDRLWEKQLSLEFEVARSGTVYGHHFDKTFQDIAPE